MDIEKSIIKKFKKPIYSKFLKALKDYDLIQANDKIAVCISGGKDSFLLAECMKILQRYSKIPFEVVYISMNPGYSKKNLDIINNISSKLNIPLTIYENNIFDIINLNKKKTPCYLCSKIRRGYLYNKAKEIGCNKIALGHHFNDVIETVLMNMFYNGVYSGMPPKLCSKNFKDMQLIRPLYLVKEEDIVDWARYNELEFTDCVCEMLKERNIGKRKEIKELIRKLKEENNDIDINIFRSLENVNVNMINGVIKDIDEKEQV